MYWTTPIMMPAQQTARFARCPSCGATNDATSKSCYLCGMAPLVIECPGCGARIANPVNTACPECGTHYLQAGGARELRRRHDDMRTAMGGLTPRPEGRDGEASCEGLA